MKDCDIISDDDLITWASELITDPLWHEYFQARQDRNRRWYANMQERNAERRELRDS